MPALALTITNAGRAALVDAAAGGTAAVRIVEAGLTAADFIAAPTLEILPGEHRRVEAISGIAADAATVHLTIRDASAAAYVVRGFGLYLDDGTLFAVYSQAAPIFDKPPEVGLFIAADLRFLPGEADLVTFGDTNFLLPPATADMAGVAKLATTAEALAMLVADKIITPARMGEVLAGYVRTAQLAQPNGVATLGADGKLAAGQRPPIDAIDVFTAANEAAMLALPATAGDMAVRNDNGRVYILSATPATTLANWVELNAPAPVQSVNGKVGPVVLTPADVGAAPAARRVIAGGLVTGGGTLEGDRTLTVTAATPEEAGAGARTDVAVTPAALAPVIAAIGGKASAGATIGAAGLLKGGGPIGNNPALTLDAASAADIIAGLRGDAAITPAALAALPRSLTPNGYLMMPGGFMMQWVKYRAVFTSEQAIYVSWPLAFAEIALPVSITAFIAGVSTFRDLWGQCAAEPSVNGCTVQLQSATSNDKRCDGFDIIVWGR